MSRRGPLILVLVILGTAGAAFCIGRVMATRGHSHGPHAQRGWMRGASAQTTRAERQFETRLSRLAAAVRDDQALLAAMLADPCSADEQILARVDHVIASHESLLRAVGEHLTTVYGRLPSAQAEQFMVSCANSLRGHVQRRYRWRGGAQDDSSWQTGGGHLPGRHGWGAAGQGPGRGRQYRGGQNGGHALARRLQMTDAQIVWAQQHDPNFEEDCTRLKGRLREAYATLLAGLETMPGGDGKPLAGLDELIEAHNSLERRVAEHIVLLRPHLSQEQRERLARLCGDGHGPHNAGWVSSDEHETHGFELRSLGEAAFGGLM